MPIAAYPFLLLLFLLIAGCGKVTEKTKPLPIRQVISGVSAKSHFNKAILLSDSARFDSAIYYFRKAAVGFYQEKGWHAYLTCLNKVAENFKEVEELDSAAVYLNQALKQGVSLLGESSAAVAQSYNNFGEWHQLKGDRDKADSLFTLSLRIRQKLYGDNHPATAESLYNMANIYADNGEYEQAIELHQKALQISLEHLGEWNKQVALIYKALATIFFYQSEYDQALAYYTKSMKILSRVVGNNHPQLGRAYANMGMMYYLRGNTKQAKNYYQKALHVYIQTLGEESKYIARVYNNLAVIDDDNGNYENAVSNYKNAIQIFSLKSETERLAEAYSNLGVSYENLDDYGQALKSFEQSLSIMLKEVSPESYTLTSTYVNLGSVHTKKGEFDKAFEYYQKALKIRLSTVGGSQLDIASCYRNIAEMYAKKREYDRALPLYAKSLEIYKEFKNTEVPDVIRTLHAIGDVWMEKNEPDSAASYYQQAMMAIIPDYDTNTVLSDADLSKVEFKLHLVNVLTSRARLFKKKYHLSGNISHLNTALSDFKYTTHLIDLLRHMYKGEEAKLFLSKNASVIYQQALETAFLLYSTNHGSECMEQAFLFSEKSKAAVLLDVIKKVSAEHNASIPDSLLAAEEELKSSIAFYEKQIFAEKQQKEDANFIKINNWDAQIASLKRQYTNLIENFEENYPAYYRSKYDIQIATIADVQKQLSPQQALLEYALTDSMLYIFAITPTASSLIATKSSSALLQQIRVLREALQRSDFEAYTREANSLYNTLILPVHKQLALVKKVIIVPDGILNYIPFEILLKEKINTKEKDYSTLAYLLNDYQTSYNYSSTLFMESKQYSNRKPQKNYLGFAPHFTPATGSAIKPVAGIPYAADSQNQLPQLNGAKQEIKDISSIFEGQYFLDSAATEARFKQFAAQYGILHLATHAVINDQKPEYSKLLFAQEKDSTEDGELHTYELYNLKLNAFLVTLSACNTGIGKIHKGEGVMSLARGFAYAGCPNVVMSLWPATDQATSVIIRQFYKGIYNGLTKDEALYRAKIQYLQSADAHTANPYFWGSFVFIGDPASLQVASEKPYLLLAGGITCLLAGAIYLWVRLINYRRYKS